MNADTSSLAYCLHGFSLTEPTSWVFAEPLPRPQGPALLPALYGIRGQRCSVPEQGWWKLPSALRTASPGAGCCGCLPAPRLSPAWNLLLAVLPPHDLQSWNSK